jgi:membrane fusion protein, copper/silver efflux system
MLSLPAKRKLAIGIAVGAALASGIVYGVRTWQAGPAAAGPNLMEHMADHGVAETYTCPMHGHVVQHHPGACPICGMTLVKSAPAAAQPMTAPVVEVDHATGRNMGVRTEAAAPHDMHEVIETFATISADESRVVTLNAKVEGWIRRIYVQGVGQQVRKGQLLYEIYSPDLQQRQREYVDVLQRRDGLLAGGGMSEAGIGRAMLGSMAKERFRMRDRLLAADMPPELVEQLEQGRRIFDVVPVRAAQDGTVLAVNARAGGYVNPMQTVLSYGDYRRTWAEITLFPDQLAWIHEGDTVVLTSGVDHGKSIRARVSMANLQLDAASRSARLRLSLDNPQQAFSPGAYAEAEIRGAGTRVLAVARDSVIRTGHGDFVVKAVGHGQFQTVPVQTGRSDREMVEIVHGLAEGDQVAVNAQFLLDSAGSLQAMQQRQDAERGQ